MSNDKLSKAERKRQRNFTERSEVSKIIRRSSSNSKIPPTPSPKVELSPKDKEKKRLDALAIETEKRKKSLLSEIRKTSIVQLACERADVGRSTYYKWRAGDLIFARAADRALEAGRFFINDLAESKLIRLIQDSDLRAIKFWLEHNHPRYTTKQLIDDYEIVTIKPSVEENNLATQEMGRMMAIKMTPKYTTEEIQEKLEAEEREEERYAEMDKKLKSWEDDEEKK